MHVLILNNSNFKWTVAPGNIAKMWMGLYWMQGANEPEHPTAATKNAKWKVLEDWYWWPITPLVHKILCCNLFDPSFLGSIYISTV